MAPLPVSATPLRAETQTAPATPLRAEAAIVQVSTPASNLSLDDFDFVEDKAHEEEIRSSVRAADADGAITCTIYYKLSSRGSRVILGWAYFNSMAIKDDLKAFKASATCGDHFQPHFIGPRSLRDIRIPSVPPGWRVPAWFHFPLFTVPKMEHVKGIMESYNTFVSVSLNKQLVIESVEVEPRHLSLFARLCPTTQSLHLVPAASVI